MQLVGCPLHVACIQQGIKLGLGLDVNAPGLLNFCQQRFAFIQKKQLLQTFDGHHECLARGHNFIAQLLAALRIAEDLLRRAPGIERRNQPQPGSGIGFSPRYLRHVAGGMAQRIEIPHGDHGNHQQQSQHGTKRNKQAGTDAPMVQGREKFEHAHSTLKEIKKCGEDHCTLPTETCH